MQINNLRFNYGGREIFSDYSTTIENGKVTWIMGPSGSGKTTLLRIIAGLEKSEGTITDMPQGKASFMFQEDRLIPQLSALDNIILCGADRKPAEEALISSGLSKEDIAKMPAELSGGMKRRVALIRTMLCSKGELILLDEAFKGLDEENRRRAADIIIRMKGSKTVIAVTHNLEDTELIKGNILSFSQ